MIELEHVNFAYEGAEDNPVLKDISLHIGKGELVVLAGTSGCGKTTLTRLLNGLIPDCCHGALTGTVQVCGKDPAQEKAVGMSARVGSVFQNPKSQFFNINSRNELAFPLENRGVPREEILASMQKASRELHMEHLVGRNMFHLSGGEKQKIAFVSVSMADTEVLVLDEPSSNLDMEAVRDLRRILELWKGQGKTVVISEHRFFFLKDLVDAFVLMENGSITRVFRREELTLLTPEFLHRKGLRSFDLVPDFGPERPKKPEDSFLQINSLQFTYPGTEYGIHMQQQIFHRGHVVAVAGHNGAGKSTFLRCLSGLQKRVDGEIIIDGKKTAPNKMLARCAMVMQDVNHQLFSDSVERELLYELKRRKLPVDQREKIVSQWLEQIQLTEVREHHPMAISGGQKQRLAIAAAALSDREIILFDEPTSGLDFVHMEQVSALIRHLADQNKLIFIVSHDPDLLMRVCDDVVILEEGQIKEHYPLNGDTQGHLVQWFRELYGQEGQLEER